MLTKDDVKTLSAFFALNDHEITRGYVYITEEAVTRRLDEIDPSWTFQRLEVGRRDDQIVAAGRLTVCGVSRDGIGMQKIDNFGEAEKGAITDALKRCARLFGIGRYILDMGSIKDMNELGKWLEKQQKPTPNPFSGNKVQTPPPPAQTTPQTNVSTNNSNVTFDWFTKPVGETWKDLHPYLLEHIYGGNKIGKEKSFAHHAKLTKQWAGMTAGDVVKYLETRHEDAS